MVSETRGQRERVCVVDVKRGYWPICVFVECWYRTDDVVCVRLMSQ